MISILKNPETRYSEADVQQSLKNSQELDRLQTELPDIKERRKELGAKTAEAKDKFDYLVKSRADIGEIQEAHRAHQSAVWDQDRELTAHTAKIRALENSQERLSQSLRSDAHMRWLDEMQGLASLRTIEVLKTNRDIFSQSETQDIRTNRPAIAEAQERLLTAIHQLGSLNHADIPTIERFIHGFEDELSKLDLSRMTRWDDIPKSRVNDLNEKPADGIIDKGMILPDGSVHIHPRPTDPKIAALGARISKLEKGSSL
jgi:hypothetical protein